MIRMGRSSKTDETSKDTSTLGDRPSTTTFPFKEPSQTDTNRAMTESESMARDIKEGRLSGFVGAGTVLTGETDFQSMLRVDGHLTGSVSSEDGTLIIGSTGKVDANVNVGAAIVNGTVNGDIHATEKLELGRTARVIGNVKTPRLLMEDGAILEGGCNMIQSKEILETKIDEQERQFATNELSPVSEETSYEETVEESFVSASDVSESEDLPDDEIDSVEDDIAEMATS